MATDGNNSQQIVNKAWNYAHVLRDDGLSYMAYTEQITFLLFLKMADEQTRPPYNRPAIVPDGLDWQSLLARDGIQHAELHLNPADMGPVSVRIAMDGNQAQVDFGADVAATRQAIEAGLPELAGALRDAGFTLTGGGVSQHSRGRDGGDASAAPRSRRAGGGPADEAPGGIHRAVRTTMLLGGLDLYA